MKTSLLVINALALFLLASACGRSNTVYPDDSDPRAGTDTPLSLPTGFYDQSVNHALVHISTSSGATQLRFDLTGGTSPAGAFNDAQAIGNRAILGIGKYDKSQLSNFALEETSDTTQSYLHVSLLVDLLCDGTSKVRTLESTDLSPGSASLKPQDAAWSVDGNDLFDSSNHLLLHSTESQSPTSLIALLSSYPNACLRNDRSDAADAPSSIPIGSVVLSMGSSQSTSTESLTVSRLSLNGDVYQTWGER